ncbi:MAG: hypothetical protein R6X02_06140 [Enhygromyxa sp.]
MTTTIEASRQLVLARLGAPLALLSGARYRHSSARCPQIYERYGQYVDDSLMGEDPKQALDHFIAFLEREREHDYDAFHYGRELLLGDLSIEVECPSDDPEPGEGPEPEPESRLASPPPRRKLPSWSRRKPAKRKSAAPLRYAPLRARVFERLGRPQGRLPGEATMLTSSPALLETFAYFDELEYRAISEQVVDEAIERLAALRERDWQAFYYGRNELLSRLPVELELPLPEEHKPHRQNEV